MGDFYKEGREYDTPKPASVGERVYMGLVDEMFIDIRHICIYLEDPKQQWENVMTYELVNDHEMHYKTWIPVQDHNAHMLELNVPRYKSTLFRKHINLVCSAFTENIREHSKSYARFVQRDVLGGSVTAIPDDTMMTLIKHIQDTRMYVASLLNTSAELRIIRINNPNVDVSHAEAVFDNLIAEYRTQTPNVTINLETQWHAIGRLADIVARLAQSKDETRI
jgi:hypothetical protein